MKIFSSSFINTNLHLFVGTKWNFRGCFVEMLDEGFTCNCLKRPRVKCDHIKSVEISITGSMFKSYQEI